METRTIERSVSLKRASDDSPAVVRGYAAVFYVVGDPGTEYVVGNIRERIARGAFTRTLADKERDVVAKYNHDSNIVLGRVSNGHLRLTQDDIGLAYEIDLPGTTAGTDLAVSLDRGDVKGSSFAFDTVPRGITRSFDGGKLTVTLTDLILGDVGPVASPAYGSASAQLRDSESFRQYAKDSEHMERDRRQRRARGLDVLEHIGKDSDS